MVTVESFIKDNRAYLQKLGQAPEPEMSEVRAACTSGAMTHEDMLLAIAILLRGLRNREMIASN